MGSLNYAQVLQKECGCSDMQEKIDSGLAWKLEGSFGRQAMSCLESGACMLPKKSNGRLLW